MFFKKSKQPKETAQPALDGARACEILQYFPIGATVQYYPEFKKNIVLETVILGYQVNKTQVFSAQQLLCEGEGKTARLLIGQELKQAARLSGLSIIIPSEGRGVGHLDYVRRVELERTGGLTAGNNITLIARGSQGKLPLVQTTVARQTLVKDGPFANTPVAILDVDVGSLMLSDQRAHMRLQVHLPVRIAATGGAPLECIMADFSERSVRLRSGKDGWPAGIAAGQRLSLAFRLPDRDRECVLRGEIYRVDYNDLVMMLEDIQRDGQFRRLEIIDILEMKSRLLHLPDKGA